MAEEAAVATEELTPQQKVQREYNELCAYRGHLEAQLINIEEQLETNKEKLKKLMKKAQNIPQEKPAPTKQTEEEVPNVGNA